MKHKMFPWLAAGIGLMLTLVLLRATGEGLTEPRLPLLMLLFISEFGFLVTVIGAGLGGRAWLTQRSQWSMLLVGSACGAMALVFLYLGLSLWGGFVTAAPP